MKRQPTFSQTELALTDKAVASWNAIAAKHGFSSKRLRARIADIGGRGRFELALTAIPTVPLLMGKIPPRPAFH